MLQHAVTAPQQVIDWANREFQREARKNDSSINLGKACLLLALEEQAALQAKLLEYQQREGNIRAAGNVGRTPASASTWSLERLDAIAAEARSAFLQLLEEDGAASEFTLGEGPRGLHDPPALSTSEHEGAVIQTSPGDGVPIIQPSQGGSTQHVPCHDSLRLDESQVANQTSRLEASSETFQDGLSGVAPAQVLGDSPAASETPTTGPAHRSQSPQDSPSRPHPSQIPSTASMTPDAMHATSEPGQGSGMSAPCTDDAGPSLSVLPHAEQAGPRTVDDSTAQSQTTPDSGQCSTAASPAPCSDITGSAQRGSTGGAPVLARSPGGMAQHAQHNGTGQDKSLPASIPADGLTASNNTCSTSHATDAEVPHRVQDDHRHLSAGHSSRAPVLDPGLDASSSQLAGAGAAGSAGLSTPLQPSTLPPFTTAADGAFRAEDMRTAGTEPSCTKSLGGTDTIDLAPGKQDASSEGAPPAGGDAAAWQLALRHPLKLLEAVNLVLFERHGYHSTRQLGNPWDADFSSVLEAGSGCPPALCILYMEICQRLGFPLEASVLEGGRYVVLWPRQPPLMVGGSRLVIDAYSGGGMLSMEEVCAMFDIPGPELVPSPRCELLAALLAVVRDTHWAAAAGCSAVPALMVPLSVETALSRRVQPGLGGFSMERAVAAAKKRLQVLPDSREAQLDYALLLYFAGQRDDAWQELGIYVEAADGSGEEAAKARLLLEKLRLMLEPLSLH